MKKTFSIRGLLKSSQKTCKLKTFFYPSGPTMGRPQVKLNTTTDLQTKFPIIP